jgi:hypothetical protein
MKDLSSFSSSWDRKKIGCLFSFSRSVLRQNQDLSSLSLSMLESNSTISQSSSVISIHFSRKKNSIEDKLISTL